MRFSHEAIYQSLYVQGRGGFKRELTARLRAGRALRVPRARTQGHGKKSVTQDMLINRRPAEAEDRAKGCGPRGARTHNLRIKSPQLYQLS